MTNSEEQSWFKTILGLCKASYTVFAVPDHDSSAYEMVAIELRSFPQPPALPLCAEIEGTKQALQSCCHAGPSLFFSQKELLGLMGVLMQFTSYIPELRPYMRTSFNEIDKLYNTVISLSASTNKPVDFTHQLNIALEQCDMNLLDALWLLFVTSRLHARWFDTSCISDMPRYSDLQVRQRMKKWSLSIVACKEYGTCADQDASGDAYYVWTHALAQVLYRALPRNRNLITAFQSYVLKKGTWLNHNLAHKYKPQRLLSDHTIAARYGNAIGNICVEHMNKYRDQAILMNKETL